ncbi:ribosomal protein bL12 [Granulicella mallensis]|uniref:50S ribosomal protein L7/L12 n=1 Tax=Granulicella mallensis (strain ATCC BAA-1857 / DSM 23137 / MP5ACTX8) TaxID=682795 RepID=G8NQQ0_GRAMM|nr:bL12 family ribosomal protein [Granulicella mallensis]AEU37276.1 Ribosomal protein L7/L12 [Granulicella mallensis MP5ACTX8]
MNNWDQWIRQSLLPTAAVILIYEIIKDLIRGLGLSRSETKQREDQFNGSGSSNQLNTSQIDTRIDARMNSILDAKIDARIGFLLGSPVSGQMGTSAAEYKTTFTVTLKERGKNIIGTIKLVREVTGLGLKDAKDLVEGAPRPLKTNLSREEATVIAKKFEGIAAIEIQ